MGRGLNKLTAREVSGSKPDGRHSDGGGLYLVVSGGGIRKQWVMRYTYAGKTREMGLGAVTSVSLAQARERAADARSLVAAGDDPISVRAERERLLRRTPTFGEAAEALMDSIESGFKNEKHKAQWRSTLTTYAKPIWGMRVDQITTDHILSVLNPIWSTKNETASRLRGRMERVLDAAIARKHRTDANPARWRGHLAVLLSGRKRLVRGHHAAMPAADIPPFIKQLRSVNGLSARALEITILTALRTSEVLGATWSELDLKSGIWEVPAVRMKSGQPHRVPLTNEAVALFEHLLPLRRDDDFVFPGVRFDRPLSNMAMLMQARRLGVDVTVHGFRSSFRDWAEDETGHSWETCEAALAHTVGTATERAYRRGDAFKKRRLLMQEWCDFVLSAVMVDGARRPTGNLALAA